MAVTSVWPIGSRLDKVLCYINNPEKTIAGPDATELQRILHYAADPDKTEALHLVSGVNCGTDTALAEMDAAKKFWKRTNGRVAYHGYQSFAPGEVTPDTAHKMGIELARAIWGDRFQVVVATHTDRGHIHNHFCVNSVSFVDGKKFRNTKADYTHVRQASDDICRAYGKSIIEHPKGRGQSHAERAAQAAGRPTVRAQIAADLDTVIARSYNLTNFFDNLRRAGYSVRRGPNIKHTSIRPPYSSKSFRLDGLGDAYTEAVIQERITLSRRGELPPRPALPPKPVRSHKRYRVLGGLRNFPRYPVKTYRGLRALYLRYLIMLGKVGRRSLPPRIRQPLREEVIRFEKYKRQFDFLRCNKVETVPQLDRYEQNLDSLTAAMTDRRTTLYKERRRGLDTDEEIESLTVALRRLRSERKIIAGVRDKTPEIKYRLAYAEQERARLTQERRNPNRQPQRRRSR